MDFSLETIQQAQQMYTGPDFPKLIREFKKIGMVSNTYDLQAGLITYVSNSGASIEVSAPALKSEIGQSDGQSAIAALKRNQTGASDFPTFCRDIAKAGIYKWVSDLVQMTCSYYDINEAVLIQETIPAVL